MPDSAGTATAFLCGAKVNLGTLGVNGNVKRGETNCDLVQQNKLLSIFDWTIDAGIVIFINERKFLVEKLISDITYLYLISLIIII